MDWGLDLSFLGKSIQVFWIDLLLSGDNAVVIALVCRSLPPRQMRRVIFAGTVAAILIRGCLASLAAYLLQLPYVEIAGALILMVVAIKLILEGSRRAVAKSMVEATSTEVPSVGSAIVTVAVADLVMSLDNIVALAAVAKGDLIILGLGLIFSIPLLMFGSVFVAALLKRYPWLVAAGSAFLGWVAGGIAVVDPAIADWVNSQAPALSIVVPALCAVFVVVEGRYLVRERRPLDVERPTPDARATLPAADVLAAPDTGKPVAPIPHQSDIAVAAHGLTKMFTRKPAQQPPTKRHNEIRPAYLSPSADEAAAASALILLVDDNPLEQGTMRRALERLGYAVETANDGAQALDILVRRPIGLLITDCHMPHMDGFQLAAQVRAQEQGTAVHLPIIGLAGYVVPAAVVQKCTESGMDSCLGKAVSIDQLDEVVIRWLPVAESLRRKLTDVAG